jgi:hypothetical protein
MLSLIAVLNNPFYTSIYRIKCINKLFGSFIVILFINIIISYFPFLYFALWVMRSSLLTLSWFLTMCLLPAQLVYLLSSLILWYWNFLLYGQLVKAIEPRNYFSIYSDVFSLFVLYVFYGIAEHWHEYPYLLYIHTNVVLIHIK